MTGILNALIAGVSGAVKDTYFNLVSLLLPGNGTNGAQNNTFQDSSPNTFPITRNPTSGPNAPTQGTFSPFSQTGWSNYFGSSTANIVFASDASFGVGTGNFSVELSVNFNAWTGNQVLFLQGTSSLVGMYLDKPSSGNTLRFGDPNGVVISYAWTPNIGQWYNIAVVRAGTGANQTTLYIDGVAVATGNSSASIPAYTLMVGGINYASPYNTQGYISNLRYSNVARTITNPTSFFSSDANTLLLTCRSNRFVDISGTPKTISQINGTTSVTPFSPFAPTQFYSAAAVGGSGYFDGTGDFLEIGTTSSFNFLHNTTATFTIQGWIYPLALPGSGSLSTLFATAAGSQDVGMGFYLNYSSSSVATLQLFIARGVSGSIVIDSGSSALIRANTWQHVAVTYDYSLGSDNAKFYINGVAAGTATKNANTPSSSNATYVGNFGRLPNSALYNFNGYTSNFRIDNSVQSISLPTSPLGTISGTQLLLNFTNAGVVDATAKNVLETVGNAQISTTQSKWGGGSISIPGSSYLVSNSAVSDLCAFGTGDFCIEFWLYLSSTTGTQIFYDARPLGVGTGVYIAIYKNPSNQIALYVNAADRIVGATTVTTGQWYHVALARASGNTRLYLAGNQQGSTYSDTNSYLNGTGRPAIGAEGSIASSNPMNGYIDDLRVTKGNARGYTGTTITVPTAPFPVQ